MTRVSIIVSLVIGLFGFSQLASARVDSLNAVQGIWSANTSEAIAVSGVGTNHYSAPLSCAIDVGNAVVGSILCEQPGYGVVGSGNLSLAANGKKISWALDSVGIEALEAAVTSTLGNWAAAKGYYLDESTVSYNITYVGYGSIPITGSTSNPKLGKTTLKIKGVVTGLVDFIPTSRSFTYTANVKFGAR